MDSVTEEQKKMIEELRRRTINDTTPKMLEDTSLFYRFAKARDFDLGQAERMLKKHIAWRKEINADSILTDHKPPEVLEKYVPLSCPCFDKEGCAVIVHDLGRADVKGFLNVATYQEMVNYMVYFVERTKERIINQGGNGMKRFQLGKPILSPVYDFEELTYSKAASVKALQLIFIIVQAFLDNYPESLRSITVINAPSFFTWIYSTVKPLLPSTVIQKVRIFGSEGWKEALLENINADDLPAYLGGNRTDPDGNPLCETLIVRGQFIPKRYYKKLTKRNLSLENEVEKITLMPLSKKEITFQVKEENLFIEWDFQVMGRDIDFSLLFRRGSPEDFEPVELIPKKRINTTDETEKGCFHCHKLGNYSIVFDNSFSWIYSKEVYYRAEVQCSKIKYI